MKKILFMMFVFFNIFNAIYAGQGSSKPSNENNKQELENNNGFGHQNELNSEIELTAEEKDLLCKVLSSDRVLRAVQKIIINYKPKTGSFLNTGLNYGSSGANLGNNINSTPIPNFTLNINANPNLTNTNSSVNNATNSNEIHITLVQQLYNLLKNYSKATGSFLYRHKYKIIIVAIIIVASILFYKLLILKYALTSAQCLTNCWQSGKALADIFSIPTSELTKDLIQTICTKFAGPEAFTNCSIPLTKFMQQMAAEKAMIIAYTKICGALAFLKVSFLFPVDNQIIKTSQERLNKISYMQKILEEFMAKKFQNNLETGSFA